MLSRLFGGEVNSFIKAIFGTVFSVVLVLSGTLSAADEVAVAGEDAVLQADFENDPDLYWTPERMEKADLNSAESSLDSLTTYSASKPEKQDYVPKTIGRLYFTNARGEDRVCSASVVNSRTQNIIITAAHCVYTRNTGWNKNIVFIPAYDNGSAPFGKWRSVGKVASSAFTKNNMNKYDYAFVKLANENGKTVQETVGGNAVAIDQGFEHSGVTFWGYPSIMNGKTNRSIWKCAGETTRRAPKSDDAVMECGLAGGASGGPWFITMDSADSGQIFAVYSRTSAGNTNVAYAAPLTKEALGFLKTAEDSFIQ